MRQSRLDPKGGTVPSCTASIETTILTGPDQLPYKRPTPGHKPSQIKPFEVIAKVIHDDGSQGDIPIMLTITDHGPHERLSSNPALIQFKGQAQIGEFRPWEIEGQYDPTAPDGEKGCFVSILREGEPLSDDT